VSEFAGSKAQTGYAARHASHLRRFAFAGISVGQLLTAENQQAETPDNQAFSLFKKVGQGMKSPVRFQG